MQAAARSLLESLELEEKSAMAALNGQVDEANRLREAAEAARRDAERFEAAADAARVSAKAELARIEANIAQLQAQLQAIQEDTQSLAQKLRDAVAEQQKVSALLSQKLMVITTLAGQIEAVKLKIFARRTRPLGYGVGGDIAGVSAPANAWGYTWGLGPLDAEGRYMPMVRTNNGQQGLAHTLLCGVPNLTPSETAVQENSTSSCTDADIDRWVEDALSVIRSNPHAKGRNWLVFNEPDEVMQDLLKPIDAAKAYNRLHQRVRELDPAARFYVAGTHPGWTDVHGTWSRNPALLEQKRDANNAVVLDNWMAHFALHIDADKKPNGVHYHNYWYPNQYDARAIIRLMEDFNTFLQAHTQGKFADLEIIVTEWASLSSAPANDPDGNRCTHSVNNRDSVMRPVAQYFNQHGAEIRHVAAAWFVSSGWDAGSQEGFGGSALMYFGEPRVATCLGTEYKTYVWGSVPLGP